MYLLSLVFLDLEVMIIMLKLWRKDMMKRSLFGMQIIEKWHILMTIEANSEK